MADNANTLKSMSAIFKQTYSDHKPQKQIDAVSSTTKEGRKRKAIARLLRERDQEMVLGPSKKS